jgi:hypothetical protein
VLRIIASVTMSDSDDQLPKADRAHVDAHARELRELAARHGIIELRFASPGRLVGHIAEDRDALEVAEFEVAAAQLLRADVSLYSDAVLDKAGVSPDLLAAEAF